MTLLAVSIHADTVDQLDAEARRAWAGGADAVEVRADTFRESPARLAAYLRTHRERTWIVTCRSRVEGGRSTGEALQRATFLVEAVQGTRAYIDFELADWRRSSDVRELIEQVTAASTPPERHLILSTHDFEGLPKNLADVATEMVALPGIAASKTVYPASHIGDSFDALDLMREHGGKLTPIAMGEDGLWTRILAKKFGSFATYCALSTQSATAPGQVTLDEIVNRYRWANLDAATRVFGVIGDPVAHSKGPLLFNHWFAEFEINAIYLPLRVRAIGDGVQRFLDACVKRPWLDLGGLSVTLPHKTAALAWVGGGADRTSQQLGALNTLSFQEGVVKGYNTDCHAAIASLAQALDCPPSQLTGLTVDVLGTGGAARAVLYGLTMFGCDVTVHGRSLDKARQLADEHGARAAAWEDRAGRKGEVLINCTSVGLWPRVNESPMPQDALDGCRLVFDLVYHPLRTQLLRQADQAGVQTLSGLDMFVRQAAMQFELWTSKAPDKDLAFRIVADEIRRCAGSSE